MRKRVLTYFCNLLLGHASLSKLVYLLNRFCVGFRVKDVPNQVAGSSTAGQHTSVTTTNTKRRQSAREFPVVVVGSEVMTSPTCTRSPTTLSVQRLLLTRISFLFFFFFFFLLLLLSLLLLLLFGGRGRGCKGSIILLNQVSRSSTMREKPVPHIVAQLKRDNKK